jgi:hypothetical protein
MLFILLSSVGFTQLYVSIILGLVEYVQRFKKEKRLRNRKEKPERFARSATHQKTSAAQSGDNFTLKTFFLYKQA